MLIYFTSRPIICGDVIIMTVAKLVILIVYLFYMIIFALISDAAVINNSVDDSLFNKKMVMFAKKSNPMSGVFP